MIRKNLLLSVVAATVLGGAALASAFSGGIAPASISLSSVMQKVEEITTPASAAPVRAEASIAPEIFEEAPVADEAMLADANAASVASLPARPRPLKAIAPTPTDDALRINFWQNSVAENSRYTKGAVHSYNTETGELTVLREGISQSLYGGVYFDGYYISVGMYFSPYRDWIIKWYLEDGSGAWVNPYYFAENIISGHDMSYDPWTDQVYSSGYLATDHKYSGVLTIDFDDYTRRIISTGYQLDYSNRYYSLTADKDYLYAMKTNGDLYRLDKLTAEPELIGNTGLKTSYTGSMMIDPRTRRLFIGLCQYANGKGWSGVYELSKETGEVISVIFEDETTEQRAALFGTEDINDGCPGVPQNLTAHFAPGEISGNLKFTVPAENRGGETLSGDITYRIVANGVELATGTTSYGAECVAPVTVPQANTWRFSVQLINDNGAGRYARVKLSVGDEQPKAPAPALSYTDGKFNLSWAPATTSVNDGAISSDLLTYDVVRYPGAVKVAEGIKETSFSEPYTLPDDLTLFFYEVTAINRGTARSDIGKSNILAFGSVTPAYNTTFTLEQPDDFYAFSVIDANNDGKTWGYPTSGSYTDLRVEATNKEKNDWLISPAIRMEAGNFYNIEINASSQLPEYYDPEIFSIYLGKEATVEAMNIPVSKDMKFSGRDFRFAGDLVKCEESGLYYVGIHAHTLTTSYGAYLRNLSISDPIGADAPDVVTDVKIASSFADVKAVEISFNAPVLNVDGKELSSIDKVEIYRDRVYVGEVTDLAPGKTGTYVDHVDESGKEYIYTFIGCNKAGKGRSLEANSFIGVRRPANPTNFKAFCYDGKTVKVTWDHPETDVEGAPLNPEYVTYHVSYLDGYVKYGCATVTGVNSAEFTVGLADDLKGTFLNFILEAQTEGGSSDDVKANSCYIGKAVEMPVVESFAEGIITYPIGMFADNNASWSLYTDTYFSDGTASYDLDGAFLGMYGTAYDNSAYISFPLLDLSAAENPVMSFYSYAIGDILGADKNRIEVYADNGSEMVRLHDVSNSEAYKLGWHKQTVSLAPVKGQKVVIRVRGIIKAYTLTLLDNFNIHELSGDDLSVLHISAPEEVAAGQEFPVTAHIENYGHKAAEGADVVLYRNGDEVSRVKVNADNSLASLARTQVVFPHSIPVIEKESEHSFFIDVEFDDDEEYSDNSSEEVAVNVIFPDYETPAELVATEYEKNTVELSWTAPDLSNVAVPFTTDSFEDYTNLANQSAGEWKFIDRDNSNTGSANGVDFGAIPGSPSSWFIFNADNAGQYAGSFAGTSGKQILLSLYCYDPTDQRDDWAISPELSGLAQTVTFYARSYAAGYEESIQVLYSLTDDNPESFTEVQTFEKISTAYTLYSIEIPEGAKYFAIRNITKSGFMCLIDDITFQPALSITVDGYNVYRNGVKVNSELVPETRYIDSGIENGNHSYLVTACYNIGESRPSNEAFVQVSGAAGIATENFCVTAGKGQVEISGAAGQTVTLTSIDGKVIASVTASGNTVIPAAPGFYLVTVGDNALKIVVK